MATVLSLLTSLSFPIVPSPTTIKHNSFTPTPNQSSRQPQACQMSTEISLLTFRHCIHTNNAYTCIVWTTWSCDLFVYIFEHKQGSCMDCIQRSRLIRLADLCSNLFQIVQKPDYWQNYSHDIMKTWLYRVQILWMEDLWSMKVWVWWLIHLTWLEVKSRLPICSEALLGWLKLLPRFFSIGLTGLRIGSANYYPGRELFFF